MEVFFGFVIICIIGSYYGFKHLVGGIVGTLNYITDTHDNGANLTGVVEGDNIAEVQTQLKQYLDKNHVNVFTPKTFAEYIGQSTKVDILKKEIEQSKKRKIPLRHILISGPAGRGKTTLVETLANEAQVKMVETITSEIKDAEQLYRLINDADGGIVFLDEIHSLPREQAEKLYTIMERFTYNGKPIKPFTLVGATTELGELIATRKPFYDRFKIPIELEDYTEDELFRIGKQYLLRTYPNDTLTDDSILLLAKNSRGTPRMVVRFIDSGVYYSGDVGTVLKNYGNIKDGYTIRDKKVLEYLKSNEKGAGLSSLCSYLDTSAANYQYEIEPYLLRKGLIIRSPRGRKISTLGIQVLGELQ